MCGIAGFISSRRVAKKHLEDSLTRMCEQLKHRGPDDAGVWVDESEGIALGHRRLSILDLSPAGHQPMHSACGRYVLSFNGEIYNFQQVRTELEALGQAFRGGSDTEVILAACRHWGLETSLTRFVGMFALALWDRRERVLRLARDRMGEKPLYYGWSDGMFLFGSELKALRAHPSWQGNIDRGALSLFLRFSCVPAPHCIYENVFKLEPGRWLTLNHAQVIARETPKPRTFWSLGAAAEAGLSQPFPGDANEAKEGLTSRLGEAVAQQMVADVPLGAFLSGGIDSSTVVALMQAQSSARVRTFSIGFSDKRYNEAHYARRVAQRLGTRHTEFYVRPEDLHDVIYQLPIIYDEPFADSSQIPTVLLCKLTRQQVTVSLSGDGGDELFGGYWHYFRTARLWKYLRLFPGAWRQVLASLLKRLAQGGRNVSLKSRAAVQLLNRVANFSDVLPARDELSLCQLMMSCVRQTDRWLQDAPEPPTCFSKASLRPVLPEMLHLMMYLDSISYLPDDILVKVDRAAMSVSLETRIPLLDHRVVEFVWSLPVSFKFRQGQGKWLLRQVLQQYVPRALIERPKKGFSVPLSDWLRGPLREWAEALLNVTRLRQQGFFRAEAIRLAWKEHLAGIRNWEPLLWSVLMFQSWLEAQEPFASADTPTGLVSEPGERAHSGVGNEPMVAGA